MQSSLGIIPARLIFPTLAVVLVSPIICSPPAFRTQVECPACVLGPGGFAMMPSKQPHWFTCTAKQECLMFVTFDRTYDIVWLKPNK